jgi:F0F1-type ATP synthase membrane subunit c/vacuolar-type H+-ATPase subunit K
MKSSIVATFANHPLIFGVCLIGQPIHSKKWQSFFFNKILWDPIWRLCTERYGWDNKKNNMIIFAAVIQMLICVFTDGCGIAICFSGHLRSFASFPSQKQNIWTKFVHAISLGSECSSDTFGYITLQSQSERDFALNLVSALHPVEVLAEVDTQDDIAYEVYAPLPSETEMDQHPHYIWRDDPRAVVDVARMQYMKVFFFFF